MQTDLIGWRTLNRPYDKDFDQALRQHHQASQFIALAGKYLVPRAADDSHTNMIFHFEKHALTGRQFGQDFQLCLKLRDLVLCQADKQRKTLWEIDLKGKTRLKAFSEMKLLMEATGVDTSNLQERMHYTLPAHELDQGGVFHIDNREANDEAIDARYNAGLVLRQVAAPFEYAYPVAIWPHHFDTATILPIEYDEEGKLIRSLGLGWAIPDKLLPEPYYYIQYWTESDEAAAITAMATGEPVNGAWQGYALRHSEIVALEEPAQQEELVLRFFDEGIGRLKDLRA